MEIFSDEQYHAALKDIELLISKGFANLTVFETQQLRTLSLAIEAFERGRYPMPIQ